MKSNKYQFVKVRPDYTGGGIYVFLGKLKNGQWFLADSDNLDVRLIDTDVFKASDDDIWQPDWQEEHLITDLSEDESQLFISAMLNWIEEHKPVGNYSMGELENLMKRIKMTPKKISRKFGVSESCKESFQDIEDDFNQARTYFNSKFKYIDFDYALERWNRTSPNSEWKTFYAKPLYNQECWKELIADAEAWDEDEMYRHGDLKESEIKNMDKIKEVNPKEGEELNEDVRKEWKPDISFKHIKKVLDDAAARGKYVNNEREEVLAAMDKADKGSYTPEQRRFIRDKHADMWRRNRNADAVKELKEGRTGEGLLFIVKIDGREYSGYGEVTDTRLYVTEHVRIYNGVFDVVGYGKYKWQNRPWQRFRFSSALEHAVVSWLGEQAKEKIESAVDSSSNCQEAMDKFAASWNKKENPDDIEESCKINEAPRYDLYPEYDSRQSFYHKAKVDIDDKGSNKLYSYGTLVAEMKDGKPVVYGTYSATTLRHIKEWLKQNGFKADTAKQIMKDYGERYNESLKESNNEIARKGFMSLIKYGDQPWEGYAILNDGYFVKRIYSEYDEDAISQFEKYLEKKKR